MCLRLQEEHWLSNLNTQAIMVILHLVKTYTPKNIDLPIVICFLPNTQSSAKKVGLSSPPNIGQAEIPIEVPGLLRVS